MITPSGSKNKLLLLLGVFLCIICFSVIIVNRLKNPTYPGARIYQIKSGDEIFLEKPLKLDYGVSGSFINESANNIYYLIRNGIENTSPSLLVFDYSDEELGPIITNVIEIPFEESRESYLYNLDHYNSCFYFMFHDRDDEIGSLVIYSATNDTITNRTIPPPVGLPEPNQGVIRSFITIWNKSIWFHEHVTLDARGSHYRAISYITGLSLSTLEIVKRFEIFSPRSVVSLNNGTLWLEIDAFEYIGGIDSVLIGYSLNSGNLSKIVRGVFPDSIVYINDPDLGYGRKSAGEMSIIRNTLIMCYNFYMPNWYNGTCYIYSIKYYTISPFNHIPLFLANSASVFGLSTGLAIIAISTMKYWLRKE